MKFIDNDNIKDTSSIEDQNRKQENLTRLLEKQFGTENVKFDNQTKYYSILSTKTVIANSADGQNWKFVTVEDKLKPILLKFIPKEMLE